MAEAFSHQRPSAVGGPSDERFGVEGVHDPFDRDDPARRDLTPVHLPFELASGVSVGVDAS